MNLSLRRRSKARCIDPGEWPARSGRARVLIEHPDRAALWAEEQIMRDAGYDVAVCSGPIEPFERERSFSVRLRTFSDEEAPSGEKPEACPLLVNGRCSLVEEADVVISTTDLPHSRGILAALSRKRTPALVVESSNSILEHGDDRIGRTTVVGVPVTESRLLEAVSEALDSRR